MDDLDLDLVSADLDRIDTLTRSVVELEGLINEAQLRVLARIAAAHKTGRIDRDDLQDLYVRYRDANGHRNRFGQLWTDIVGVSTAGLCRPELMTRYQPNMPDGSWRGPFPLRDTEHRPRAGVNVVYALYDRQDEPCYVGSTGDFRARLRAHKADGKRFTTWAAWPCKDREEAYQREVQLLRASMPYLNRKVAR
jgi:hypothetical protein